MSKGLLDTFLELIKIDSQSSSESSSCPSTEKQFDVAKYVEKRLLELGLIDVSLDSSCYLMGTMAANTDEKVATIGFIAHLDTAPDFSGKDVIPHIVKNYDGKAIILNEESGLSLDPNLFPEMKEYIGKTLITTNGKSLLGADDKAGVAIILDFLANLKEHPEIKHGKIRVGFTPDEEIGRGADKFNVELFNADFAYTIDSGGLGYLEYENFNAALGSIKIQGENIHPGYAKNKMINAIELGMELCNMLPQTEKPEHTTGYEGFFHVIKFNGTVEEAYLELIIRDHNKEKFQSRKDYIQKVVSYLNSKYGEGRFVLNIKDQYLNMIDKLKEAMYIVDIAKEAMKMSCVEPIIAPIRGGTDGSRLSYMGLPCPNIFAGYHNGHGKYEYAVLESMEKAVETLVNLVQLSSELKKQ